MTREEAIKVAYGIPVTKAQHEALQFLIPELAESEDERIMSALLRGFNSMLANQPAETFYGESIKDIIDYLERQKDSLHITEMCKENAGSFTDEDEDRTINGCLLAANAERRCKRASEELLEELGLADYTKFFYEQGVEKGKKEREKQKEQKPPIAGNDFGWIDELKHDLEHPEELDQKVDDVLKQRKGRSLEWSEEDEKCLQELMQHIEHCCTIYGASQPAWRQWLNLLKSLERRGKRCCAKKSC